MCLWQHFCKMILHCFLHILQHFQREMSSEVSLKACSDLSETFYYVVIALIDSTEAFELDAQHSLLLYHYCITFILFKMPSLR